MFNKILGKIKSLGKFRVISTLIFIITMIILATLANKILTANNIKSRPDLKPKPGITVIYEGKPVQWSGKYRPEYLKSSSGDLLSTPNPATSTWRTQLMLPLQDVLVAAGYNFKFTGDTVYLTNKNHSVPLTLGHKVNAENFSRCRMSAGYLSQYLGLNALYFENEKTLVYNENKIDLYNLLKSSSLFTPVTTTPSYGAPLKYNRISNSSLVISTDSENNPAIELQIIITEPTIEARAMLTDILKAAYPKSHAEVESRLMEVLKDEVLEGNVNGKDIPCSCLHAFDKRQFIAYKRTDDKNQVIVKIGALSATQVKYPEFTGHLISTKNLQEYIDKYQLQETKGRASI